MTEPVKGPQRVGRRYVERLVDSLSARDWAIIWTLNQVRLATGTQLQRLHFSDLSARGRITSRSRVLKRLADARVVSQLERRVGTARRGSSKACYALDSAGQQLVRLSANLYNPTRRVRPPVVPGERFTSHALVVTELYVALAERARSGQFKLVDFKVEPSYPDGLGYWIRPDALVVLSKQDRFYWWYEADLGTESLATVRRKMLAYVDYYQRGQVIAGEDVVPLVDIGVLTEQRRTALRDVVRGLPAPADEMFLVSLFEDVPAGMVELMAKG